MKLRRTLACARMGAAVAVLTALGLVSAGSALAASPAVSVRVEGASRTLLSASTVHPPASGSTSKGGAPAGACRADTAAGALDVATHHRWNGTYSSSLGIDVTSILGTTLSFAKGSYWGFYVNDRYASKGVCSTAARAGEQLLFAALPAKGKTPLALVVSAPRKATAGTAFAARAFAYTGKGNATRPVSGATFTGATGTTNAAGVAQLTAKKTGRLRLVASHTGYVRSAAAQITVTR